MKITLQNFKCWEDNTFDLGNKTATLISGKSGVGKTSIIQGIIFALYGLGNKVISHGKTSCKVIFEYEDIKIVRTKRPNIVVLNDKYEDDAAQEIIDNKFGKNFDMTGYIRQGSQKSFILLNPQEKLEFLETIAFNNVDVFKNKKKISELIKYRNDKYVAVNANIEMTENVLENKEKPEIMKFPIKCKPESRAKLIKNYEIKEKNCLTRINKLDSGKLSLLEAISYAKIYHEKYEMYTQNLNTVEERLKTFEKTLHNINLETLNSQKDYLLKRLQSLLDNREFNNMLQQYQSDQKQYDELLENETREINNKLEKIESKLWKEYTREEINDNIDTYKSLLHDMEKIIDLEDELEHLDDLPIDYSLIIRKLNKKIEDKTQLISKLKLENETYNCPSCNERIIFKDGKLVKNNNEKCEHDLSKEKSKLREYKKDLAEHEEKQKQLLKDKQRASEINSQLDLIYNNYDIFEESRKFDINEYADQLDEFKEYKETQEKLEKEINNLNASEESSTLKSLKSKLDKLKQKLEEKPDLELINESEEELREKISTLTIDISKYEDMFINQSAFKLEKEKINKTISESEEKFIKKYKKIRSGDEFQQKYDKICQDIQDKQKELKDIQNTRLEIEKFLVNEKELKEYTEWKEKLVGLKRDEQENRDKLTAANELKTLYMEAESLSTLNLISTIQETLPKYLDMFFEDNSMNIELHAFKEKKRQEKKSQINIKINYKDCETDISSLSGGELQRVVIAFNLTLSEMFNIPFLLLDECTSNLDQDLTNTIINGIKSSFPDKKIIIIAHQVITGIFDSIIKI